MTSQISAAELVIAQAELTFAYSLRSIKLKFFTHFTVVKAVIDSQNLFHVGIAHTAQLMLVNVYLIRFVKFRFAQCFVSPYSTFVASNGRSAARTA